MPDKTATKLCPTCGTRLSEDATRCLVCGAELGTAEKPAQASKAVQGSRMPHITLSLPAAIGLLALFLTIGALLVFFALRTDKGKQIIIENTPTATVTITVTPTQTPTAPPPTATDTPQPTATPVTYTVKSNDTCLGIAAFFKVSVQSIVTLNNLSTDCVLTVGNSLLIPQPTPTLTPPPSSTPNPATQTAEACKRVSYTVQEGDTPGKIATNYNVPWEAIKQWNGIPGDTVFIGSTIVIPLCERPATPGPTPTNTPPPPYPAPNLLLPPDGAPFTLSDESVTLQWAAVGTLREDEAYQVVVVDITEGKGRTLTDYVSDTKYIVPESFRPNDSTAHVLRWTVTPVRKNGVDMTGKTIWVSAGAVSAPRVFTWSGTAGPATTPTP